MTEQWRVFEWYSFSHWGMVRLPLFTAPDWFILGACHDTDDEDIEFVEEK
jgi:hypothetical protein